MTVRGREGLQAGYRGSAGRSGISESKWMSVEADGCVIGGVREKREEERKRGSMRV